MKKELYERLLPSTGVYCVSGISNGVCRSRFTETLDGVHELIEKFKGDGSNVYVTPNSFSGHSRSGKYGLRAKSLFVDLDVGDDEKKYPSQAAASDDLERFLDQTGLPVPVVINSGTGLQAYWIFTQDLPVDDWKPLAETFKQFCTGNGLKIDVAVTADVARLMRCPETLNYKTDPPSLAGVLSDSIDEHDIVYIKSLIGAGPDTPNVNNAKPLSALSLVSCPPDVLANIPRGLDEETAAIGRDRYADLEAHFSIIVEKSITGGGCEQIKRLLTEPTRQTYDEWFWGLSIAARCVDGEEAIHKFSDGHPDYNRDATIAKAQETLKISAPQTCARIESFYAGGCVDCPYKGRIGSPLAIGRQVKPLAPEKMPEEMPILPEAIAPYSWSEGGVWYSPPSVLSKTGKWVQDDPYLICSNIFYPILRMYGKEEGAILLMRAILPKDPEREFELPVKYIGAADRFREFLASQDITPTSYTPAMVNRMIDYTLRWNDYLKSIQTAEIMQTQMGWTENRASFVVGFREVTYTGEIRRAATSVAIKKIAKMLAPTGTMEAWQKSANALDQPGMEHLALGLLCGFGSPLMDLTNTPGVTVCFTGAAADGKSGALYAGLSVWGNPQLIAPNDKGATAAALVQRYVNLKNILMGVDEVHNILPDTLSNFIFSISQGVGKLRLHSSHNAERDMEAQARLICVMTSNSDLHNLLKMGKANPEGEVRRFIQFLFRKPPQFVSHPELAPEIIEPFNKNYGHAGAEYMKAIYTYGLDYAQERLEYWKSQFDKTYGKHTRYSHYKNFIACLFAGGEIAVKAGIFQMDLNRVYRVAMDDMIHDRDKLGNQDVDYVEIFNSFLNENIGKFLKMNGETVIEEPIYFKEFIGRKELHTGLIFVHRTTFHRWLSDPVRNINISQFDNDLMAKGILITPNKKKRLGAFWKHGDVGTVNCYWFKMDIKDVTKPDSE